MRLRERLADVEYEIAKEQNKMITLREGMEQRLKDKELGAKHNFKWALVNQLGLEQAELEIKIREAVMNKFVNEVKFLRLEIQEIIENNNSTQ